MDNTAIRRTILGYIYQKDEEKTMYLASRQEIVESLGIEGTLIDNNVLYLEGKGYLKLIKCLGSYFSYAQITSEGKDLVENPGRDNSELKIDMVQNIVQGSVGTIIGNRNVQNIDHISNFQGLYHEINNRNPLNRDEIVEAVKTIESELKKEKCDTNIIKKTIQFLKDNAAWVVPILGELLKKSFGV